MAILALIVSVSAANAEIYRCEFKADSRSNKGWVPEIVYLSERNGNVAVMDPIIKHYFDDPQIGKVISSNAKRTTYGWTLRKFKTGANQFVAGMQYRLVRQKRSNQASISGRPIGYDDKFYAVGTCAVDKS